MAAAPAATHLCCRTPISPPSSRPVAGILSLPRPRSAFYPPRAAAPLRKISAAPVAVEGRKVEKKPEICTADELHFVDVYNSDWKLALWRYLPSSSSSATRRKHPLLLLSGIATNAVGFDLCPEASFARSMAAEGFDTWVLELRGSGLSILGAENEISSFVKSRIERRRPSELVMNLLERFSSFFDEGNSLSQFRNLSQRLADAVEGTQQFISPDFREVFATTLEDVVEELEFAAKCNWDFDHYLEEDLPSAMEYIRSRSEPNDGKLFAVGHSMGGILLYAMLARSGSLGRDSGVASIATLGSSLDYTPSNSSLKLLLPVADPAKALNVPAIPVGKMISTAHRLSSNIPYLMPWLKSQITIPGMLDSEALKRLVSDGLCTVPAKLLLQMTTAFQEGGLRNRTGNFFYKHHLRKSNIPVLALAGDRDLICPPAAVYETAKVIRKDLVTYRVIGGGRGGANCGHFDLVGGRLASREVYPLITDFLGRRDL